jgi:hypothetical protein
MASLPLPGVEHRAPFPDSTPAAPTRSGRSSSAPPNDPGPDWFLADTRLGSTARSSAAVLVKHRAWYTPVCYPGDRILSGEGGRSRGHVRHRLRPLEGAG